MKCSTCCNMPMVSTGPSRVLSRSRTAASPSASPSSRCRTSLARSPSSPGPISGSDTGPHCIWHGRAHSGAAVTGMMLDLNSLKSVRSFAKAFLAEFDRLDSLVLNAGVFVPPYSLSADGLETQFAVNHVAHQLLAQLLQERLVASAPSTVVVLSSNGHYGVKAKDIPLTKEVVNNPSVGRYQCYARSKAANVLFAQELSTRISAHGVRVNAVHPGTVHTAVGRHIRDDVVATLGDSLQPFWDWVDSKLWDAETASLTQLYAAVSPEIAERNITGKYFHPIARVTEPDPATADAALQRRLWDFTEALCAE
eukprot:TRINITY_DN3391_c0_g1_i1.p1 TRINITY_DN3391_c0_g1~~TRINITY_DN3391_c0_g1_i1.p1  ORF type:complete len:310 (+),score=56.32 TRINITY_DN3391_c0_g1_i1:86-1015(+)